MYLYVYVCVYVYFLSHYIHRKKLFVFVLVSFIILKSDLVKYRLSTVKLISALIISMQLKVDYMIVWTVLYYFYLYVF